MIKISRCSTESEYALALKMTRDYIEWLHMDLAFQAIDEELSHFSSMYGPLEGMFLLAWQGQEPAGGGGLRRFAPGICEMKRLYVYDRFKGRGVGRRLCVDLIEEAKRMGYKKMRLDTLGRMGAARSLYKNLGFIEIESYRFNPDPTTTYMELNLSSVHA